MKRYLYIILAMIALFALALGCMSGSGDLEPEGTGAGTGDDDDDDNQDDDDDDDDDTTPDDDDDDDNDDDNDDDDDDDTAAPLTCLQIANKLYDDCTMQITEGGDMTPLDKAAAVDECKNNNDYLQFWLCAKQCDSALECEAFGDCVDDCDSFHHVDTIPTL